MPAAIELKNITKQYPVPFKREVVNAVENVNLTIEEGEIFGFLGPNGAGKTTTIKILLGLIYPTEGEAYVLGAPAGDIEMKHKIAYLPENPYFYEHMTAREVVTFYGQLFGMKREDSAKKADELLDLVGLQADSRKTVRDFSKGMKQRVGIAQSLINEPSLLFYDEPTSGLDAVARREIRDLMFYLKDVGKTMFLSSHYLEDVQMVANRVSIIHRGKLQKVGRVEDLVAGGNVEIIASGVPAETLALFRTKDAEVREMGDGKTLLVLHDDPNTVSGAIDLIRGKNGVILSVTPRKRTLEDVFLETISDRSSSDVRSSNMTPQVVDGEIVSPESLAEVTRLETKLDSKEEVASL